MIYVYRLCPRDFSPLSTHEWGAATFLLCETCHGVLLEATEVKRLLRGGTHPPLREPAAEPTFEDGSALCSCSGVPMSTVFREGVRVDLCPVCKAIWFDPGELERVVKAKRKEFLIFDPDPPGERPAPSEGMPVLDALGWILKTLFWTLG